MGFTLDEGYTIMKLAAKKETEKLKSYREEFIKLSETKNMSLETADKIFKMIVDSGLYSFNESHAIAYAIMCYITGYLKTYYPREFLAANLTNAYERKESVVELIADCRRLGFSFTDVNINTSSWEFGLDDNNSINIGFCAVKSFGEKAYDEIVLHRPFSSLDDLIERVTKRNCGKRALLPAIFTGSFSEFYESRLDAYNKFCEITEIEPEQELSVQGSKEKVNIYSSNCELENVFFGAELVSSPINSFISIGIDNLKNNSIFIIQGLCDRIKKHKDRNGNPMAFLNLSTGDGVLEAVIFNSQYEVYKKLCKKGLVCNFTLKKNNDNYIINKIETSAA